MFRSAFDETAFSSACAVPFVAQNGGRGAVYLFERDTERADLIMTVQGRIRVASLAIAGLAVVLVGSDPASQVYVASKVKRCQELGIYSEKSCSPPKLLSRNSFRSSTG